MVVLDALLILIALSLLFLQRSLACNGEVDGTLLAVSDAVFGMHDAMMTVIV